MVYLVRTCCGTRDGRAHVSPRGVVMSKEGVFLVYCMEAYRAAKGALGRQVCAVVRRYDVFASVRDCYEALHTAGERYIVSDIDAFIAARSA